MADQASMERPKLIYLARRNPALDAASFVPRWRQHGALGMSMARWKNVWRYVHCDVLRVDGGADVHDGVGIVWHRSAEARRAHREDRRAQQMMERDELETFAQLVRRFCALYRETVLLPPAPGARAKLVRFLHGPEGCPADGFVAAASPVLDAQGAATGGALRGQVRNVRAPPEAGPWGLDYELIEEWWFDDLEAAARARTQFAGRSGLEELGAREVALLTNEVVLYQLAEPA